MRLFVLSLLFCLSAAAAESPLGFALKQSGRVNISYEKPTIETTNAYEARVEALWFRSQLPREEIFYTVTLKEGSWIALYLEHDGDEYLELTKGQTLRLSLKKNYNITILAISKYNVEIQIDEADSRPISIQMPKPLKYPATTFEAYFVK